MTRNEIESEILRQLKEGACPNPTCKTVLKAATIVRSGISANDKIIHHNGVLTACAVVYKIVRCSACLSEFRCEQAVPKTLYNAAYG